MLQTRGELRDHSVTQCDCSSNPQRQPTLSGVTFWECWLLTKAGGELSNQCSYCSKCLFTIRRRHTGHCRRPAATYPMLMRRPQNHSGNSPFFLEGRKVQRDRRSHWALSMNAKNLTAGIHLQGVTLPPSHLWPVRWHQGWWWGPERTS